MKIRLFTLLVFVSVFVLLFSFWGGWTLSFSQREPIIVVKTIIPPAPPPIIEVEEKIVERIVEVERIVKVNRELRDFTTYVEFREVMQKYHEGILLVGGTCIEQSRLIVEVGRGDGFYLDTEMVLGDRHMVVKGFLLDAGNGRSGIGLFDQETGLTWLKYQTAFIK